MKFITTAEYSLFIPASLHKTAARQKGRPSSYYYENYDFDKREIRFIRQIGM